ncbi:hypothetical protein D3C71_1643220 [compost metagenome]
MKTEQANSGRNREFEEIACTDQCRRTGNAVPFAAHPVQKIGEPGVQIDLDKDGDCKQADDGWLGDNLLALEGEEKNQCCKQRYQRNRLQPCENAIEHP